METAWSAGMSRGECGTRGRREAKPETGSKPCCPDTNRVLNLIIVQDPYHYQKRAPSPAASRPSVAVVVGREPAGAVVGQVGRAQVSAGLACAAPQWRQVRG
eukprot:SAG11_NODE_12419_length_704_cov_1.528926_2_plen_101_part_01